MNNFFEFEKDIKIINGDLPEQVKIIGFGGTPWFSIDGISPEKEISMGEVFTLPKGEYEISIDKPLKGRDDTIWIRTSDGTIFEEITNLKKVITIEKQTKIELIFLFDTKTNYIYGDYYESKEDYGKDYSINIYIISGGNYESTRYTCFFKGDTNKDGKITLEDIVNLRAVVLAGGEVLDESTYDIDGNGELDSVDLLCLRRYLSGSWFFPSEFVNFKQEIEYE